MTQEQVLDGRTALADVIRRAGYPSVLDALAAHTVFLHPVTVKQTRGLPLFKVIRARNISERGSFREIASDGHVMLDDNTAPTDAFLWSCGRGRGVDVVFNHVWTRSNDWRCYTALWNLCATPAFLTKLTDGDATVTRALRRRSYELYGYLPAGESEPAVVEGLADLPWAESPAPVENLESVLRERLRRCGASRTAESVRRCGWAFGGPAGSGAVPDQ